MGLDNGIEIRRKDNLPNCVLCFDNDEWRKQHDYDLEVAYWRKCWNVRALIYDALGVEQENDNEVLMDRQDLLKVLKALKGVNKKNWDDCGYGGGSIWEWDEYKQNHRRNITNLKKLARIMKRHPELEVIFYDSY